jgi:uncharacterized YigZ family protein
MESDCYLTIKSVSKGLYKEKGSRFIASAIPISNLKEIKGIVDGIRREYHDAKHHCYAYMIGYERNTWRVNDDGEPSGTGGKPILGQINSKELTNILIVVSRYFGGTLLGVSGLLNAYRMAAADAIANSTIIKCTLNDYYEIVFQYSSINEVMKILKEEGIGQSDQKFDIISSMVINFRVASRERITNRFNRINGLTLRYIETR